MIHTFDRCPQFLSVHYRILFRITVVFFIVFFLSLFVVDGWQTDVVFFFTAFLVLFIFFWCSLNSKYNKRNNASGNSQTPSESSKGTKSMGGAHPLHPSTGSAPDRYITDRWDWRQTVCFGVFVFVAAQSLTRFFVLVVL